MKKAIKVNMITKILIITTLDVDEANISKYH